MATARSGIGSVTGSFVSGSSSFASRGPGSARQRMLLPSASGALAAVDEQGAPTEQAVGRELPSAGSSSPNQRASRSIPKLWSRGSGSAAVHPITTAHDSGSEGRDDLGKGATATAATTCEVADT